MESWKYNCTIFGWHSVLKNKTRNREGYNSQPKIKHRPTGKRYEEILFLIFCDSSLVCAFYISKPCDDKLDSNKDIFTEISNSTIILLSIINKDTRLTIKKFIVTVYYRMILFCYP